MKFTPVSYLWTIPLRRKWSLSLAHCVIRDGAATCPHLPCIHSVAALKRGGEGGGRIIITLSCCETDTLSLPATDKETSGVSNKGDIQFYHYLLLSRPLYQRPRWGCEHLSRLVSSEVIHKDASSNWSKFLDPFLSVTSQVSFRIKLGVNQSN